MKIFLSLLLFINTLGCEQVAPPESLDSREAPAFVENNPETKEPDPGKSKKEEPEEKKEEPKPLPAQTLTVEFKSENFTFDSEVLTLTTDGVALVPMDMVDDGNGATELGAGTLDKLEWIDGLAGYIPHTKSEQAFSNSSPALDSGTPKAYINQSANVLLLHFNEDTSTLQDDSATAASISCTNCPDFNQFVNFMDGIYEFNGTNDEIDIAANALQNNLPSLSISVWIKPESYGGNNEGHIISKSDDNDITAGWALKVKNSYVIDKDSTDAMGIVFEAGHGTTDLTVAVPTVRIDQWQHVVVTWDRAGQGSASAGVKFYIDGVEANNYSQQTDGSGAYGLDAAHTIKVGDTNEGGRNFKGGMDELALFGRVLTAQEVSTIYGKQAFAKTGSYTSIIRDTGADSSWQTLDWEAPSPHGKELTDAKGEDNYTDTTYNFDMVNNLSLLHMEEIDAGKTNDTSGDDRHGNCTNCPTPTLAKFGNGLTFDETDDVLTIADFAVTSFSFCTWAKWDDLTGTSVQNIFSWGEKGSAHSANFYVVEDGNTNFKSRELILEVHDATDGDDYRSANGIELGKWHHLCFTKGGTGIGIKAYIDSKLVTYASSLVADETINPTTDIFIGGKAGTPDANAFLGATLDEAALWSTVLTQDEIDRLYDRGARSVKFQARLCIQDDCSDETFKGPDGTADTYYSEQLNKSVLTPAAYDLSGITAKRYFQYKALVTRENLSLTPLPFKKVTVGPTFLNSSRPELVFKNGPDFTQFDGLKAEFSGTESANVKFQISHDGNTWYFYDGAKWVEALSKDNANVVADINKFAGEFDKSGKLTFKAIFNSGGGTSLSLDSVILDFR